VLQNASNRNAEVENAQGLLSLYTQEISAAIQSCNPAMLMVAQETAEELDRLKDRGLIRGETVYAEHVLEVQRTMPACVAAGQAQVPEPTTADVQGSAPAAPVAPELVAQSRNLELRAVERQVAQSSSGSVNASAPADTGRSFAVLSSYAVSDESTYSAESGAVAHYNQLASAAAAEGLQVQVYRTAASNHFALVLPADSFDAARDLVTRARTNGWAPDAFAMSSRPSDQYSAVGWTRCPEPISAESLRACAGSEINRPTQGRVARVPSRSRD
jgi:hypothetical protein